MKVAERYCLNCYNEHENKTYEYCPYCGDKIIKNTEKLVHYNMMSHELGLTNIFTVWPDVIDECTILLPANNNIGTRITYTADQLETEISDDFIENSDWCSEYTTELKKLRNHFDVEYTFGLLIEDER